MDMFEKMKEIICNYVEVDPASITEDSRFIEDLGFNSYDIMCMLGDAETDIGGVVIFLASHLSQYMTGRTLFADGGKAMFR